ASRESLWSILAGDAPAAAAAPAPGAPPGSATPVLVDADLAGSLEAFRASRLEMLERMEKGARGGSPPRLPAACAQGGGKLLALRVPLGRGRVPGAGGRGGRRTARAPCRAHARGACSHRRGGGSPPATSSSPPTRRARRSPWRAR